MNYIKCKASEFEKHAAQKKIVLFGAGSITRKFLSQYNVANKILYILDNDTKKSGTEYSFQGYKYDIVTPGERLLEKDEILVITTNFYKEIRSQLEMDLRYDSVAVYIYNLFEYDNVCDVVQKNDKKKVMFWMKRFSVNRGSEALMLSFAKACKTVCKDVAVYLCSGEPTFRGDYRVNDIDYYMKETNNGEDVLDSFWEAIERMDLIVVSGADNYTKGYRNEKKWAC